MERFRQTLLQEISNLKKLRETLTNSLKNAPEGSLRVSSTRKYPIYLLSTPTEKNRYLSKKNLPLIRALAQKEYDEELLGEVEKKLRAAEEFQRNTAKSLSGLHLSLCEARRNLILPRVVTDEEYAAAWQREPFQHKEINEEAIVAVTRRKENVRSKSEAIIADILDEMGVPYRYEAALHLEDGHTLFPDFTCLNVRTRQVFYWEHLGMMDDPDYLEAFVERLRLYMRNGIFQGENLLFTFETSRSHPSRPELEKFIRRLFL